MLLPPRERSAKSEWSTQKKFAAVGVGLLIFFLFGIFSWNMYTARTNQPQPVQTGVPTLQPRP
jgi:hypothetical protein